MARDYKDEYEKFQKDKVKYRSKLNKYNRDKGTYGNGDNKDASHENGKITGFVDSSTNKGKKEASRLKGSTRKAKKGGKYALGGQVGGKSPDKAGEMFDQFAFNIYEEHETKEGGKINGPSHEEGGVNIEVEGGEIVINKNINDAAGKHEDNLLKLNKNPDNYKIVKTKDYKDANFDFPVVDSKDRRK